MFFHSSDITKLMSALAKAQDEFPKMKGDGKNPHFNSKYITLESAIETLEPILRKHELAISQPAAGDGNGTGCTTILSHTGTGQFIGDTLLLPSNSPGKETANAQSGTAAVTYARRTAYLSILGIVQADDDGNSAVGSGKKKATQPAKTEDTKASAAPASSTKQSTSSVSEPAKEPAKKTALKQHVENPANAAAPAASVFPTEEEFQAFRDRGRIIKAQLEQAGVTLPGAKLGTFFLAQAKVDALSKIPKLTYELLLKSMELLTNDSKRLPEAVALIQAVVVPEAKK